MKYAYKKSEPDGSTVNEDKIVRAPPYPYVRGWCYSYSTGLWSHRTYPVSSPTPIISKGPWYRGLNSPPVVSPVWPPCPCSHILSLFTPSPCAQPYPPPPCPVPSSLPQCPYSRLPLSKTNASQHVCDTRSGRGALTGGARGSGGALHSSGWVGRGVHQASGWAGMGARTEKGQ